MSNRPKLLSRSDILELGSKLPTARRMVELYTKPREDVVVALASGIQFTIATFRERYQDTTVPEVLAAIRRVAVLVINGK